MDEEKFKMVGKFDNLFYIAEIEGDNLVIYTFLYNKGGSESSKITHPLDGEEPTEEIVMRYLTEAAI